MIIRSIPLCFRVTLLFVLCGEMITIGVFKYLQYRDIDLVVLMIFDIYKLISLWTCLHCSFRIYVWIIVLPALLLIVVLCIMNALLQLDHTLFIVSCSVLIFNMIVYTILCGDLERYYDANGPILFIQTDELQIRSAPIVDISNQINNYQAIV